MIEAELNELHRLREEIKELEAERESHYEQVRADLTMQWKREHKELVKLIKDDLYDWKVSLAPDETRLGQYVKDLVMSRITENP